jgi:pSer/pThr/pTyr-binding forkhead associated (FHA) protein
MGSKNGIQVNDKEVLEQQLHNNDIIEIGDIRLKFIIPEQLAEDLEDTQMFKTQIPGT